MPTHAMSAPRCRPSGAGLRDTILFERRRPGTGSPTRAAADGAEEHDRPAADPEGGEGPPAATQAHLAPSGRDRDHRPLVEHLLE